MMMVDGIVLAKMPVKPEAKFRSKIILVAIRQARAAAKEVIILDFYGGFRCGKVVQQVHVPPLSGKYPTPKVVK